MKVKKLLTLAVAVLCAAGAWADTAILSDEAGWSKITSFPATLSDYYFVFVDKNNDLMLFYNTGTAAKQGTEYKTMIYTTSQDPTQNRGMLWEISTNTNGGWSIKSSVEPTYYIQTEWEQGWFCRAHDNGNGDASWYNWTINYTDETDVWTIQNGKYPEAGYIGPWDAAAFSNGNEVAANKTATTDIGHFYIYAIKRIDANVLPAITYLEGRTDNTATITSLRTKYTDGTYTNSTTANDVYNDYKALEVAALSSASAGNYTSALVNPSFESGTMTGWTTLNQGNETYPFYLSDVGAKVVSSYPLSNSDGDYIMNYYAWSWSWSNTNGIQQTIPNMPAGTYRIEAVLGGWKDWKMVLDVNGTYQEQTMTEDNKGEAFTVDVTLASASDLVITAKTYAGENTWRDCFLKADNFKIYNLTHYYDELNAAITVAEGKTLGFDEGEYAPYENVTAITALNEAKDVDQSKYLDWSDLQTLVSDLGTWTPNEGEVNAIYDGTLKNAPIQATSDNVVLPGWVTKSGNTRQTFKGSESKACLDGSDDGVGLFVHPGTYNYGETTGYTMPLKGGVVYVARAKYCAWENESNNDFTLTVKKGDTSVATQSFGANTTACTVSGALKEVELFFSPTEDGDHVLSVVANGNTFMTDFYIERATIAIDENAACAPTVAGTADVSLTRTFNADAWNTLVLPFDMTLDEAKTTFGSGVVIANYTGTETVGDDEMLKFSTEDASIAANEPVFIWGATAVDGATISNRSIEVAATPELLPTGASYSFVGSYAAATTLQEGDYFIGGDNNLYSVGAAKPSMKGTRAFFRPVSAGVKVMGFSIDDETTGIMTLDGDGVQGQTGSVYTLAGQRVSKPAKGLYIVDGKKMVIK